MKTGLEAYINGIGLSTLGNIYITNISYKPAELEITTASLAQSNGENIVKQSWTRAQVTVEFVLLCDSPAARQAKYNEVVCWFRNEKSLLQVSDRPWQQLRCICTDPPKITRAIERNERLSMTFTAFETPFWEERTLSVMALTGTEEEGVLYLPGNIWNAKTEITATPDSGTLNSLSITVGGTVISFTNLGATSANPLTITYDDRSIQSIKVGPSSAMSKRTSSSSDDLLAKCGANNQVGFTANVAAEVIFKARGLWL